MSTFSHTGMIIVHPLLVPFVNQLYTPTRQEIEWAEQVTAGVRVYQRTPQEYREFIGPPHLNGATHILETHRKIQALESSLRPITEGETVRAYFSIDSVEDAGRSGKYSVVTSSQILVNQRDEVVFRATKQTMYPKLAAAKLELPKKRKSEIPTVSELRRRVVQNATFCGNASSPPLVPNQLYVHRMVKVFTPTEAKGLATLIRATNQHHLNVKKFNTEDLVAAGPLVEAATVHNVADDFGDILYQEVVKSSNVNRTNQEDMIGSVSYIHSIQQLAENPDLEEVTVRTLGIKNLDVEELLEREVPVRLFSGTRMKTSDYEEICREDFPLLYRRIVTQVLWKFLRLRPLSSSDEVPAEIQPKFS
ncbi:PREDICTED: uncharacterized protein LOC109475706 isoform X2 [Branchiostoma belcheri]|uniref:Uncharacterized protein LOC109475706 isoform X2 n=1 Tax=Branchiostoma belcheri TaxID=7741 RepID=A0A6P4ZDP5_BRABE|nr:PREDICTED: uncharacterized protein LOC109475706 isoform X2 [Branchiostoma belcheri]